MYMDCAHSVRASCNLKIANHLPMYTLLLILPVYYYSDIWQRPCVFAIFVRIVFARYRFQLFDFYAFSPFLK